jgi:hypothetical protein
MDSDYTFRLLGGYVHVPDSSGADVTLPPLMKPSDLQRFLVSQHVYPLALFISPYWPPLHFSPGLVSITRTTLSKYDVDMVIIDRAAPGSGPAIKLFSDALGLPKVTSDGFSTWQSA